MRNRNLYNLQIYQSLVYHTLGLRIYNTISLLIDVLGVQDVISHKICRSIAANINQIAAVPRECDGPLCFITRHAGKTNAMQQH